MTLTERLEALYRALLTSTALSHHAHTVAEAKIELEGLNTPVEPSSTPPQSGGDQH